VATGRKGINNPHARKLAKHHMVDLAKVTSTGTYNRITPIGIEMAAGIQPKSLPAPGGVHVYYSLVEDKYELLCGSRF
jgi:pyruvate/2-oxoglutarate dehydrogenase complex dihydrolipoamide acyltransferase (E2) component